MAGHSHFSPDSFEEYYEFSSESRKKWLIALVAGLVLFAVGCFLLANDHGTAAHAAAGHGADHAAAGGHEAAGHAAGGHDEYNWKKRLFANLWMNSVLFTGIALVGMFFVSIQYLAKAGWSSVMKRIPEAFPSFLPVTGVIMLVVFLLGGHDIFHWTHEGITDKGSPNYDPIIAGKSGYLNTTFFLVRLVIYFVGWYMLWRWIRSKSIEEDLTGGTEHFYKMVKIGTGFIVFFGVTSSTAAWDWSMSVDSHWFSTMFGWYHFASWHVTCLSVITLTVLYLKDAGYMKYVNDNHIHDLGKFMFAFSIFWTYVWFCQFLLIYYAGLSEETVYFWERWWGNGEVYRPYLVLAVFLNFIFPFLVLMTRDAKRNGLTIKIAGWGIIIGHYLDFFQMLMPGIVGPHAGFGLLEIGTTLTFISLFALVVNTQLQKASLVAKNHPFLEEATHHDI
jgi:hypothetical protein